MSIHSGGISYERRGAGRPLVLIHGLGASRLVWKPQLEVLARERDVIALDMPGFGASSPLAAGRAPTPPALAEAIAELLAAIGIERPHVAGNSLGGWVALELARSGHTASACLISPAGLWRQPLGPRRVDTQMVARRLRPAILAAARRDRLRERMLATTVARPRAIPREDAVRLLRDWIDAPGYAAANAEMRRTVFEDPAAVRVPVTIAWGEHDRLVRAPRPERRPPGSRFELLAGCGHTPNWDDPALVARVLLEASDPSLARSPGAAAA